MCEYCENNTKESLRGDDGILKIENGTYSIYINHYNGEEIYINNIEYCPRCGRKLKDYARKVVVAPTVEPIEVNESKTKVDTIDVNDSGGYVPWQERWEDMMQQINWGR